MVSLNIDNKDSISVAFDKISDAITQLSNEIQGISILTGTASFATKGELWDEKSRIDDIIRQNKAISSCIGGINESITSLNENLSSLGINNTQLTDNINGIYSQLMVINSSIISQNNLITEINKKLEI